MVSSHHRIERHEQILDPAYDKAIRHLVMPFIHQLDVDDHLVHVRVHVEVGFATSAKLQKHPLKASSSDHREAKRQIGATRGARAPEGPVTRASA